MLLLRQYKQRIEYLYLDLKTCDRCVGTDAVLDEVVETLRPALELAGYQLSYRKQEVYTVEIAASYRFLSSPTILVNGQDIFDTIFLMSATQNPPPFPKQFHILHMPN